MDHDTERKLLAPMPPVVGWLLALSLLAAGILYVTTDLFGGDSAQSLGRLDPVPGSATVYLHREDGCREIQARAEEPVEESVAQQARLAIADGPWQTEFGTSPVRGIGVSRCGEQWVVSVGVRHAWVDVPAYGPGGTPVLAYVQEPIYAH